MDKHKGFKTASDVRIYDVGGQYWQPFSQASHDPVEVMATVVARRKKMRPEILPVDDNLLVRVHQAEQNNKPCRPDC
jgi:hypothetical protein